MHNIPFFIFRVYLLSPGPCSEQQSASDDTLFTFYWRIFFSCEAHDLFTSRVYRKFKVPTKNEKALPFRVNNTHQAVNRTVFALLSKSLLKSRMHR